MYSRLSLTVGTLSKDYDDGGENIPKKMNLRPFKNFVASIWNRSIRQM